MCGKGPRRRAPRAILTIAVIALAAGAGACGGEPADIVPVRLIHTPAIDKLKAEELQSLSLDCGKYPPHGWARGRYEAAYCEQAMAAWSDAPLQMLKLPAVGNDTR